MKLFKPAYLAAALALLLIPSLPARAVDAPKQAIGEDTALVVWVDLEQVDTEMIEKLGDALAGLADNPILQDQAGGIPLGDISEMVDALTLFRSGFVQAGGEGLLLTLEMPEEGSWSPPISLLARTKQDVDAKAMGALVRTMTDGAMDAELAPVKDAEGWHDLAVISVGNGEPVTQALPSEPDKKAYKAFDEQLGEVKKPLLSVAFRMQDDIRDMIGMMAGGGAGGQQDPQAAMMLGMLGPLQNLDTIGFAVSEDDEEFEVDAQMVFQEAADAQQFGQMYNSIMQLAPALLAAQLQNVEDAPDPNTLNDFFMKLQMKQNGDTLKLHLDKEFFEMAEQMAPLFESMGGGFGGPGADL